MIKISEAVGGLLNLHGFSRRDYGDPRKIINNVFLKRSDTAGPRTPEVARRFQRRPQRAFIADESENAAKRYGGNA